MKLPDAEDALQKVEGEKGRLYEDNRNEMRRTRCHLITVVGRGDKRLMDALCLRDARFWWGEERGLEFGNETP